MSTERFVCFLRPLALTCRKIEPIICDEHALSSELGRFDEAIAECERILRLNPNYPLAHYHLGQAYERKGQQVQARSVYEQFLQIWKTADTDIPEVVAVKQKRINQS